MASQATYLSQTKVRGQFCWVLLLLDLRGRVGGFTSRQSRVCVRRWRWVRRPRNLRPWRLMPAFAQRVAGRAGVHHRM